MQCLSAPIREEIDKGHRERIDFDIGIPSVKNLKRISRIKLILWALIAVSSVPLHLVYNSVIFSTRSTYSYAVLLVTPDFFSGAPFSDIMLLRDDIAKIENIQRNVSISKQDQSNSEWQELDSRQCREVYQNDIVPDRSNILAVSSANSTKSSLVRYLKETSGVPGLAMTGSVGVWVILLVPRCVVILTQLISNSFIILLIIVLAGC